MFVKQVTTSADEPAEALATPEQAADFLNVSRSTIYEMLNTAELASIRVRRCRRIRWADLHAIANGDA